jgi:hypothetical protein
MKFVGLPLLLALAVSAAPGASGKDKDKPSISLKANPVVAFSPARVVVTADIKGGPNDYEDFYCPTVEWWWGDGTTSDQTVDCEPYEPGKSEIKRHFTISRVFESSGDFRIELRLKKKDKVIGLGSTMVKIRPGVREIGG